jgi:hypothetical protein
MTTARGFRCRLGAGEPPLLNKLRERITTFLSQYQAALLSTSGTQGAWAMPVRYCHDGLHVDCLIPRWADIAFHLEQDPRVLLLIPDREIPASRWLQIAGTAEVGSSKLEVRSWKLEANQSHFPLPTSHFELADLFLVVRITPHRIDLIDETWGWGARETLDL